MNFEIFMENIKKTKVKESLLLDLEHNNMPTMDEVIALQKELFSANRSSWLLGFDLGRFVKVCKS